MGYALAQAAIEAGAKVTLISGPVNLAVPARVHCIDVVSAAEMLAAVMKNIANADIFFSVAAVADYQSVSVSTQKLAKKNRDTDPFVNPHTRYCCPSRATFSKTDCDWFCG